MDFKGQTAVLSAILVVVGMMILVPAITEKALAGVKAVARGTCGPEGQTHPCEFTLVSKGLSWGKWVADPTPSGTSVGWETSGKPLGGKELGNVQYKVGEGEANLWFSNPAVGESGKNTCGVNIWKGSPGLSGSCHAGSGIVATFTYTLRSVNK
jgi:hypothetical protein